MRGRDDTTITATVPREYPVRLAERGYAYSRLLGSGGTSMVFEAIGPGDRRYAVKALHARHRENDLLVEALRDQAAILAELSGVPGLEQLVQHYTDLPGDALVLEFIDGETLADRLHDRTAIRDRAVRWSPMPVSEATAIALELARPLRALHEHPTGVVHHDVKPGNIMLTGGPGARDSTVHLIDLGFARARWRVVTEDRDRPVAVRDDEPALGLTWHYAAPEQMRRERCNGTADMWSWASVLFVSLAGRLPFGDLGGPDYRDVVLNGDCRLRAELLPPDVPDHVRELIALGLERDPLRRLGAAEAIRRLEDRAAVRVHAPSSVGVPAPVLVLQRDEDRRQLHARLTPGTITFLHGLAGVGKTTLAIDAAHRQLDAGAPFVDGVRWIDLSRADPEADAEQLARWIVRTAGLSEDGHGGQAIEALAGMMRRDHILLVLDNFETVLRAGTDLLRRLGVPANSAVMVTTTRLPRLAPHWSVQELHELEYDERAVPVIDEESGLAARDGDDGLPASARLFIEIAERQVPDFEAGPHHAVIREICRTLAGMPFAIAIVAPRVRDMSLEAIRDHLDEIAVRGDAAVDGDPRHASCMAAVEYTMAQASAHAGSVLARLARFPVGADLEAIEAVCVDMDPPFTIERLVALTDAALLEARRLSVGGASVHRYRVPPLVRLAVAGRLSAGDEEAVDRAHLKHFLHRVEAAPTQNGQLGPTWADAADLDAANLRRALEIADSRGDAAALGRLVKAMSVWWGLRRPMPEAMVWARRAATAARSLPDADRMRVMNACGQIARDLQAAEEAERWYEDAIRIADAIGDTRSQAILRTNLGLAVQERDDVAALEQAGRLHRESLERCLALTCVERSDARGLADMAALNLAVTELFLERTAPAEELLVPVLERLERVDGDHQDHQRIAAAHELLGIAAATRGALADAAEHLEQALNRQVGVVQDRVETMLCVLWLGVVAVRRGDEWRGRTLVRTARDWLERVDRRMPGFHARVAVAIDDDTALEGGVTVEPITDFDRAVQFALVG